MFWKVVLLLGKTNNIIHIHVARDGIMHEVFEQSWNQKVGEGTHFHIIIRDSWTIYTQWVNQCQNHIISTPRASNIPHTSPWLCNRSTHPTHSREVQSTIHLYGMIVYTLRWRVKQLVPSVSSRAYRVYKLLESYMNKLRYIVLIETPTYQPARRCSGWLQTILWRRKMNNYLICSGQTKVTIQQNWEICKL